MSRHNGLTVAAIVAASVIAWSGNAFAQAKIVDGPEVRWKLAAWGKPRAATQNIETLKQVHGRAHRRQVQDPDRLRELRSNPRSCWTLLKVGSLEMTNICASYHPGEAAGSERSTCPSCRFPTSITQEKVHLAWYKNPLVVKEFAGWNAMPYLSAVLPTNEFVGRGKAPKNIEDFKGMRVRALAGIGDAMRKLGAVPTSVDATEVYTSLSAAPSTPRPSRPPMRTQSYLCTYEVGKWYTENMNLGNVACPDRRDRCRWLGRSCRRSIRTC